MQAITRKGKFPMRCENCHEVKWIPYGEWDAKLFTADNWICDECSGRPHIFTLAEFSRSERE